MIEKLSLIEDRYREIEMLLSNPEIAGDYNKSQNLIKEHASLKNVANLTFEYRTLTEAIDETKSLIKEENDRDITELAREELDNLELQKTTLENNLRIALLPKDPNDSKNVIMEIRAGTGGDEAGLFAADLYRMYNRYAQRNSWQIDIINNNESGLGSIKEIVFKIDGDGAYSKLKHEMYLKNIK